MQQIPPGLRPQMRKNGPVGHSVRRRGNDSTHFCRFTGRVCTRTALRGTIFRICVRASSLAANCNKSALVFFRKYSIPPGLRPQMRKNCPVVHSARRRGNDSAHFGRFTGRVCTRTALRGTFSAFAAGQAVWPPGMASQLSRNASTSNAWSPLLWAMFS